MSLELVSGCTPIMSFTQRFASCPVDSRGHNALRAIKLDLTSNKILDGHGMGLLVNIDGLAVLTRVAVGSPITTYRHR